MKKLTNKELGTIIRKIDRHEPDATLITLDQALEMVVNRLLYMGEVEYKDSEGQKYSIIVSAL